MTEKTSIRLHVTLSNEMDSQLREIGEQMGLGRCSLIRIAIKFYLDYHEKVLKELKDIKKQTKGTQ